MDRLLTKKSLNLRRINRIPIRPKVCWEEQRDEVRDYSGDADDKAHDETWKKLEKRRAAKKKWKTLVLPDPEAEGETLTFRYREIDPGGSLILQDVAIMTGVVYKPETRASQ